MQAKVVFPTLAMLAVLTMGSMASFTVAVIAPAAAPDIGVPATYIGFFTAVMYVFSMASGAVTGDFIRRYGGIRVCQFTMFAAAASMACFTLAVPLLALVSAVLLGFAYGPFNPASAHVLTGISTARSRPLIFSIKQTGVPLGGMLAGATVPALVLVFGWRGAALTVGAVALAVAALVQPLRLSFDADRRPRWPLFGGGSILESARLAITNPLRRLSISGFAYSGCQVCIGAFFVVYLTQALGLSLVRAGALFAFVQAGGIIGRVVWGSIADRWLSTQMLLVLLGGVTAACALVTAGLSASTPTALIAVLGFVLGTSSFGWVGVYLSEVARLAPEGRVAEATGGVQLVYFGGVVVIPPTFGAFVSATGSYITSFIVVAVVATASSLYLLASPRTRHAE